MTLRTFFNLLVALTVFVSFCPAKADDYERFFIETHPLTIELAPGVYQVPTENGFKTYGYDDGGREYLIRELQALEAQLANSQDSKTLAQITELRTSLEQSASITPLKASDSGTLCSTAHYDLTADVFHTGIWSYAAHATAGFQQWGGGPSNPYGPAQLSTFALAERSDGTILASDSHSASFPLNGFSFVSADPASVGLSILSCSTLEALSVISIPTCPQPNFRYVSETLSPLC